MANFVALVRKGQVVLTMRVTGERTLRAVACQFTTTTSLVFLISCSSLAAETLFFVAQVSRLRCIVARTFVFSPSHVCS